MAALLLCGLAGSAGARGRVQVIANGSWDYARNTYDPQSSGRTVVTDQGTRLRGTAFWAISAHAWAIRYARDFESWQRIPAKGFNSVRLALNNWDPDKFKDPFPFTDAEWTAQIDQWVDWGEQLGIYVILDHHEVGEHSQAHLRAFWGWAAARYRDRPHVLYEIANEPVGWHVSDYTAQDIADQQEIYDLIRAQAPETHIILLSFAIPEAGMEKVAEQLRVDWRNASVGFHGYWVTNGAPISTLKRSFPAINTEFMKPGEFPGSNVRFDGLAWQSEFCERMRISWNCWDANYKPQAEAWTWDPLIADARAKGYWWPPDTSTQPSGGSSCPL